MPKNRKGLLIALVLSSTVIGAAVSQARVTSTSYDASSSGASWQPPPPTPDPPPSPISGEPDIGQGGKQATMTTSAAHSSVQRSPQAVRVQLQGFGWISRMIIARYFGVGF